MGLVLMCPASDTRHFPKTCARRWSRSFRASISSKTSPWRSLRVLSTRRSRQKEHVTRISARTSSATTSGAISTSKFRIHLFRIHESVESRPPYGSKAGRDFFSRGSFKGGLFSSDTTINYSPMPRRGWPAQECLVQRDRLQRTMSAPARPPARSGRGGGRRTQPSDGESGYERAWGAEGGLLVKRIVVGITGATVAPPGVRVLKIPPRPRR